MVQHLILVHTLNDFQATQLKKWLEEEQKGTGIVTVGDFLRPDDFCDHGNWITQPGKPPVTQIHVRQIGWRVCTQCNKPIPDMSFLTNQIKPQDIRNPEHERIRGKDLGFYTYGLSAASRAVNREGNFT